MAVIQMQKVAIIAHSSVRTPLIDRLYDLGVMQISEQLSTQNELNALIFEAADLEYVTKILIASASPQAIANLSRISHSQKDIEATVANFDFNSMLAEVRALEAADTASEANIEETKAIVQELELWVKYPYIPGKHLESAFATVLTGIIPTNKFTDLETHFEQNKIGSLQIVGQKNNVSAVTALVLNTKLEDFEQIATQNGWTNYVLPTLQATPAEVVETAKVTIQTEELAKKKRADYRRELAIELPKIAQLQLFNTWEESKQSAYKAAILTDQTLTFFGWMPRKDVNSTEAILQREFTAATIVRVKPEAGEEPPVHLKNAKWLTPFESVTNLYGLPLPAEFDPTSSLSPFFILYFALCLTDAGYGLVLAIIFGGYVLKNKLSTNQAKLPWLLFMSGIVTFFVSIPFGGWFGLQPSQVPSVFTTTTATGEILFKGQVWNLGAQSGINFLQNLALVLGITHLFFGMFLAGYYKWIHHKKMQAIWQDFSSHLLLAAALFSAFAPAEMAQTATYTLYFAVAFAIWGKGYGSAWYIRPLMGIIGLINFGINILSNGLSYLRLLALGLVTGAMALAINQVAIEIGKLMPFIFLKIIVIISMFIVGHLISIALNTLGSFIHSGRLQFIEFFGQFFEGGGKAFVPFRRNT